MRPALPNSHTLTSDSSSDLLSIIKFTTILFTSFFVSFALSFLHLSLTFPPILSLANWWHCHSCLSHVFHHNTSPSLGGAGGPQGRGFITSPMGPLGKVSSGGRNIPLSRGLGRPTRPSVPAEATEVDWCTHLMSNGSRRRRPYEVLSGGHGGR